MQGKNTNKTDYVQDVHDDLPDNVATVLGPSDSSEGAGPPQPPTMLEESIDETPMTNESISVALSTIMDMTTGDEDGKVVTDDSKKIDLTKDKDRVIRRQRISKKG